MPCFCYCPSPAPAPLEAQELIGRHKARKCHQEQRRHRQAGRKRDGVRDLISLEEEAAVGVGGGLGYPPCLF